MDLQVRVRKQVLTCRQTAVSNSVNFVRASFMFDDEWAGTTKHVIFTNGDIPSKEIILDSSLVCTIPWEVLEQDGLLYISVVGVDGDKRITTRYMENPIIVYASGELGGSEPLPPSPSAYDSIMQIYLGTEESPIDMLSENFMKSVQNGLVKVYAPYVNGPLEEALPDLPVDSVIVNVIKFSAEGTTQVMLTYGPAAGLLCFANGYYTEDKFETSGVWDMMQIPSTEDISTVTITKSTKSEEYLSIAYTSEGTEVSYYIGVTGIGSRSDLQTPKKDTIVDAVNSTWTAVDSKASSLDIAAKIESDNIVARYDPSTDKIYLKLVSSSLLDAGQVPQILYRRYLSDAAGLMATVPEGFMYLDSTTYKMWLYSAAGLTEYADFSEIADNIRSFLQANRYRQLIVTQPSSGVSYYQFQLLGSNTAGKATSYIGFYSKNGSIYKNMGVPSVKHFFSNNDSPEMLGTSYCHFQHQQGPCEQTVHYAQNDTYGLIQFFAPNTNPPSAGISFGQQSWSNAQAVWNGLYGLTTSGAKTLCRALDNNGVERVSIYSSSTKNYSNIDNNKHSVYCKIDGTTCICLSSSGEILWRSFNTAAITSRKTVTTSSDLFSKELQFCSLAIYGDTLFAYNLGTLYAIDYLKDNPVAVEVSWSAPTNTHSLMKAFGDRLVIAPLVNYSNDTVKAFGGWVEEASMHKEASI